MESSSYEFSSFEDGTGELERLKDQAAAAVDLELMLLRKAGIINANKVLEIGCGPGFVTPILAKAAPDSEILAVDFSEELLSRVDRNAAGDEKSRIHIACCSGSALPVREGWSDFTYARFLLQHVPGPAHFVEEAYRSCSVGGIFCVVDSDDGLLLQYPEDGFVCDILAEADAKQQRIGGDRKIGRKLPAMLHTAGFVEIETQIVQLTPKDIPFKALLRMGLGYKAEFVGKKMQLEEAIGRLEKCYEDGGYFFSTGIFIVTGKKGA